MGKKKKKNNAIVANVLFFIVLVVFFSVALELVLRLTYPAWRNFNSEMWRYSTEIKKISDIPGVSHLHQANKSSTLYGVEIRTNSLGFRDREYSINKAKETKRILVLGDSITLGWGVNFSDIYTEVLEKELTNYEVMNGAVGNYNSEMEAEMLKEYLYLKPDALIIGFFVNDGEKTIIQKEGPIYELKKNLFLYPFFWDRFTKISYMIKKGSENYTSKIHEFYSEDYGGKERVAKAFKKIKETADENKIKVYVVILPQLYNEFDRYDSEYIHTFVKEQCKTNGFVCIDILPEFKKHTLSELIISREDAHPNALGHKIIADRIYEVMKNE